MLPCYLAEKLDTKNYRRTEIFLDENPGTLVIFEKFHVAEKLGIKLWLC
jgi:hypothetical protein